MSEFKITYKIVLVGDPSVGKTSFLYSLIDKKLTDDCLITVGVDFKNYKLDLELDDTKVPINLHIWDTSGQPRVRKIVNSYYQDAIGFLVFFDINKRDTFNNCEHWISDILKHKGSHPCKIMLMGCKYGKRTEDTIPYDEIADFVFKIMEKYNIKLNCIQVDIGSLYTSTTWGPDGPQEPIVDPNIEDSVKFLVGQIYREWPIQKPAKRSWFKKGPEPVVSIYPVGIGVESTNIKSSACFVL